MRVLLVRHGQSDWNAERRLQGQADSALSEIGRAQADDLRPVMQAIRPCRAIASDLRRARETAERMGYADAAFTPGLREVDVGEWTGRSIAEIRAQDEEGYAGWRAGTAPPPGGETWESFVARTVAVIDQHRARPCANLLVVCHGGVIRALLHAFLDLDPKRIIPVGPGSLTAFRLSDDASARLELFNYRPGGLDFEAPD